MTVVPCERSATPKLVFHTRSSFTSAERPSSCFVLVAFKELHKPSAPVLKESVIVAAFANLIGEYYSLYV